MAAWSLAIEEWFYLLFPLVLLALAKSAINRRRGALICILIFLTVPVLLRWCLLPRGWSFGVRGITLPRLDAITYGVALAFIRDFQFPVWQRLTKCWPVGLAATLVLGGLLFRWYGHDGVSHPLFYEVFYFCLTSLGLALCFPRVAEMTAPDNVPARCVRNLSLWSYSIYLSHVFFMEILSGVFTHFGWNMYKSSVVIGSGLIWLTSLSASAFLYRYFEKPVMDRRDQPLSRIFSWSGKTPK
jgi:peptidoglycan/LPS O-acetylase OafA/YrhL